MYAGYKCYKAGFVNDDGSTSVIQITTKFPYFDDIHDSLYVSTFVRIQLWRKKSNSSVDKHCAANSTNEYNKHAAYFHVCIYCQTD